MAAQSGYWLELPVLIGLYVLTGLRSQKLMPGSNRYTDWSDFLARPSPQHPRHISKMASQTGHWYELPVIICLYLLKGSHSQKLIPGSNRYTGWSDFLDRPSPQQPRHISKMASQTGYWYELPVFICFSFFFIKGAHIHKNQRRTHTHKEWCQAQTSTLIDFRF